jgi:aminoglycoside/choline kinase family phosphotransferase
MDFFLLHALGLPLAEVKEPAGAVADARSLLHRLCGDVHGTSARRPMVLCHRDYHARNLLVVSGDSGAGLAVIDFQDMRRGPRAYDLASLAWDPYVSLPDSLVGDLVETWRPEDVASGDWHAEVALAAGQRLLKAAGSYAYLARERGLPRFRRWLEPALRRAMDRLAGWEHRDELRRALLACGVAEVAVT